jgi:hypothetical protein
MSEAYERERYGDAAASRHVATNPADVPDRQNNALLDELAGKVSALRGVTVDIYENARNHELIDSNV